MVISEYSGSSNSLSGVRKALHGSLGRPPTYCGKNAIEPAGREHALKTLKAIALTSLYNADLTRWHNLEPNYQELVQGRLQRCAQVQSIMARTL